MNGDLPVKVMINIAEQIARGLATAHAAGIVHRDIKPENVMVRPDGLVKILDFGLAKPSDLAPTLGTEPSILSLETDGMMMGTVSYLSPEQVRRQEVDHRTDIFSLGVVLYEMLAGERPFQGQHAGEVFDRIIHSEPKPITSGHSSAGLNRIIERALAKDPAARYENAEQLRADLAGAAPTVESAQSSRWRKAAVLVAGTALLAAIGLWFLQTRRESRVAPPIFAAAAQKLTDLPQEEMFPTLSPDGKTLVFASTQSGTWDIYRQAVGERVAINLTASADNAETQPAISPDGARIAFRSFGSRSGVFVMNLDGSNITEVTDSGSNPAWSPDGNELAVNDDHITDYEDRNTFPSASKLWAVSVASGQRRLITSRDAVQGNWSPGGQRLAFWGEQKGAHRDIWTVASDGKSEPVPVTDDGFIDWNPIWSPDGHYLYFLSNRGGEMNLWRIAIEESSGRLLSEPEPATLPSNNCQHVSFARNGNSLVYGHSTRSENVWQIGFDPVR
ncbi:MAG TPA: protein kinase, partial [Pyrinomonadaceae bacterium]